MGTKNDPGDYDCYENADPDEPMFVLLGRDRHAPELVLAWATMRENGGEEAAVVAEARQCAYNMLAYRQRREEAKVVMGLYGVRQGAAMDGVAVPGDFSGLLEKPDYEDLV
jgi:hypothetical protein